jgi:hypothetical protein
VCKCNESRKSIVLYLLYFTLETPFVYRLGLLGKEEKISLVVPVGDGQGELIPLARKVSGEINCNDPRKMISQFGASVEFIIKRIIM